MSSCWMYSSVWRAHTANVCRSWMDSARYGCPFCKGDRTCPCDSFILKQPKLFQEYDLKGNIHDPFSVSLYSNKRYWWICRNPNISCPHHRWRVSTSKRMNHGITGCHFCDPTHGKNICQCDSLAVRYPRLLRQYNLKRNIYDPFSLGPRSHKYAWWLCTNPEVKCDHHQYITEIAARSLGGCRYCVGTVGFTCSCDSLAMKRPEILKRYDLKKNIYDPFSLYPHSRKSVWWRCINSNVSCDHHIDKMTPEQRGLGCSFCAGGKCTGVVCQCDSLAIRNPHLLKQYNLKKNIYDPFTLATQSNRSTWWICINPQMKRDHEWKTMISDRHRGSECPRCFVSHMQRITETYLDESKIVYKPEKTFDSCRYQRILPFDIYIASMNILIELDGQQHFVDVFFNGKMSYLNIIQIRDRVKTAFTRTAGIHFLRISYSEKDRIEKHVSEFIEDVKKSSVRLERFVGQEYKTPTL